MIYWLAAAVFVFAGATALIRPQAILAIRSRLRPHENADPGEGRRREGFGPVAVRICGVILLFIGAALVVDLMA